MSDNNETKSQPQIKLDVRLKRDKFDALDSSIACVAFIVFSLVFDSLYLILPTSFKGNLFGSILLSFLVEAIFGLAVWFTAGVRKVRVIRATNMNKKIDFFSVLLAIAISLISITCFGYLTNVFMAFLEKIGYTSTSGSIIIPNVPTYLIYVFLICITPAFFEDLLFRGTILNGLKEKRGVHKAVAISAVIFMLMHGGPDQTIHQLILGFVLGYALVASGSLWVPIIIHFVNNFTAVTMQFINDYGKTAVEEVVTKTEPLSWGQIGLNLMFALVMAAGGFALCCLCFKRLKRLRDKREEKEKQKEENVVKETEIEVEVQSSLSENMKKQEQDKKSKRLTIILFSISFAYLVIEWVIALITGFIV